MYLFIFKGIIRKQERHHLLEIKGRYAKTIVKSVERLKDKVDEISQK